LRRPAILRCERESAILTDEQKEALHALGVQASYFDSFCAEEQVVFYFSTESTPGIGIVQFVSGRVRCGIVEINDRVSGLTSLVVFRNRAMRLAKVLGADELELFGAAFINQRFEALLLRQSYVRQLVPCPDELGDAEMEILSRIYSMKDSQ
jgi:hypothetical protein